MFLFWDCDLVLKKSCYTKLNAWLIRCSHHHHERNSFTTNFILLSTIGIFTLAPFGKDCLKKGQYLSMKSNILLHKLTTRSALIAQSTTKEKGIHWFSLLRHRRPKVQLWDDRHVMAKLWEFVWEYLRPLLGIKKYSRILYKNTSPHFFSASPVIWLLTMLKRTHSDELSISRFTTYIREA